MPAATSGTQPTLPGSEAALLDCVGTALLVSTPAMAILALAPARAQDEHRVSTCRRHISPECLGHGYYPPSEVYFPSLAHVKVWIRSARAANPVKPRRPLDRSDAQSRTGWRTPILQPRLTLALLSRPCDKSLQDQGGERGQ